MIESPRLNMSDWVLLIMFAGFVFHQMPEHDFMVKVAIVFCVKVVATIIYKIAKAFKKAMEDQRARAAR